jgi:hypothetical protein
MLLRHIEHVLVNLPPAVFLPENEEFPVIFRQDLSGSVNQYGSLRMRSRESEIAVHFDVFNPEFYGKLNGIKQL